MSETVQNGASSPATEEDRDARDDKIEQAKAKLDDTATEHPADERHPRVWWHRHLESEERQRVMAELGIKRQPHWGFRFAVMLGLSVVVGVMGLSADSAAVVIGAMLLAPLMQPVLATAACISMALFRKALHAAGHVLLASVGAIALSYVLAALFVTGELPSEVTSRVAPDIRDLAVALGAGAAGAYATVRKDVSSSLPGVAVAVALVPPLGVVGITLEAGEGTFARGALLLYVTNLAAIVLVASIVFIATGFVPPRRLAQTFRRTAAVAAVVAVVVVAITVPLYRASLAAAQQTERELEAQDIATNWLDGVEFIEPVDVEFGDDQRIQVRVRSFEAPIDDLPLTEAMRMKFGPDRVVSLEWERLSRFETTSSEPPATTTTIVDDAAQLVADIEQIADDWLQNGDFDGVRRIDSLLVGDGIIRIDASGVGDAPSLPDLTDALDAAFDETFEVQLTWVERRSVTAPNAPTTDELLLGQIAVVADEWAETNATTIIDVSYADLAAVVEVAGATRPDATDLVADLVALLPADADVQVLFVQRLDITADDIATTTAG